MLINKKNYYKKGILKSDKPLEARELYKVRNCIAHGEYYLVDEMLVLYDYNDIFEFDCTLIEKMFQKYFELGFSNSKSFQGFVK